jgi:hypothetical protein
MSQPRRPSRPIALLVLAAALAAVPLTLFGGTLVNAGPMLQGRPWPERYGGLLAHAREGFAPTAVLSLPLAAAAAGAAWGTLGLVGVPLGRRGLALAAAAGYLVGLAAGPTLGAAYQRRRETAHWDAVASRPTPTLADWDGGYFDAVPADCQRPDARRLAYASVVERKPSGVQLCLVCCRIRAEGNAGAAEVRARALAELTRRAASPDPRTLADLVTALCSVKERDDPDLERLRREASPRLADVAAACPDRFLLSHLVATIRRHGLEDDPDCARLVAVWEGRVVGRWWKKDGF